MENETFSELRFTLGPIYDDRFFLGAPKQFVLGCGHVN